MQFSRVIVAALFGVSLLGCGQVKTPIFAAPTKDEQQSFVKMESPIEITGQKGVARREGSTHIKTFTVDNKKTFAEDITNKQVALSYTLTVMEEVRSREDNWYQPNNYRYYEFLFSEPPRNGVIDQVYVNGAQWSTNHWAYNATNNTLYFPDRYLPYNTQIRAVYKVAVGALPSYAFDADKEVVGLSISDATTGAAVTGSFSANIVTLQGVTVGQKVLVKFYRKSQETVSATLRYEPIAGSVKINLPECESSVITVNGTQFTANCQAFNHSMIPLSYEYNDVSTQIFNMAEVPNPNIGRWEVQINGVVMSSYRREGKVIYIDQVIQHGSKVDIFHYSE